MSKNLYEHADIYDLVYSKQSNVFLENYYKTVLKNKSIKTIHDCSFGTGHLSFVLSDLGYEVSGSDISAEMLQNAQINAQERGLSLKLVQSDFRMIDQVVHETFDCVMATGNSLAHVPPDDVKQALWSMTQLVKTGGYLYFDTRNWDKITREKQRFFCYNPFFKGEDRINLVQVWDYVSTSEIVFNLLHTFEREGKIYKKEETSVCYYPIFKDQLLTFLGELGYDDIELFDFMRPQNMDFDEMNWYALCARKR